MVRSFCSKSIVLLFLLIVPVSCNNNNKSQWNVPNRTWTLSTIAGSAGFASSIARDSNDKLHISYYDGINNAVAYISNATGTWSPSTTVDTTIGNVAGNVSTAIAVDSTDTVHISYGSYTRNKLLYATVSAGTWTTSTVDSALIRHTSIATDSNNNVHIGYYDQGTGAYKYATNANGSWDTTTLDTSSFTDGSCSIAIDSHDKVHVVYMGSSTGSNNDVMYATNASGTWKKSTIVPGRSDSASGVSIARDSRDRIHISYYDAVYAVLMHATNASGAWTTEVVDDWAYSGVVSSIAVGPHDNIHIAYSYFAPDGSYLTYATQVNGIWWAWTLDNVGVAGFSCSITTDSNDRPHISYWDGNFSNLKYATAE